MRVLACTLALAVLAAGCTTADQPLAGAPRAMDASQLWAPAAASHDGRLDVRAETLALSPVDAVVGRVSLHANGSTHLAFRNATVDGQPGWVVFASGARLVGAGFSVANATLVARAGAVTTTLADDAGGLPADGVPVPGPLRALDVATYRGLSLPDDAVLAASNLSFYDASGAARVVPGDTAVGLVGATLHAFAPQHAAFGMPLDVDLGASVRATWNDSLRVEATDPTGTIVVDGAPHALGGRSLGARFVGAGAATIEGDGTVTPVAGALADVVTDGTSRLGARVRLAPDALTSEGPAGNVTRVKLVLAETSGGADAHVTGFRVNGTTARYVGSEPMPMTRELLDLIQESEGPVTPALMLTVGVALPFVALVEGVASFFSALFPPSIAGPIEAGQARVVTFELMMPAQPTDVEILIEAQNAPPTRAVVRMTPT